MESELLEITKFGLPMTQYFEKRGCFYHGTLSKGIIAAIYHGDPQLIAYFSQYRISEELVYGCIIAATLKNRMDVVQLYISKIATINSARLIRIAVWLDSLPLLYLTIHDYHPQLPYNIMQLAANWARTQLIEVLLLVFPKAKLCLPEGNRYNREPESIGRVSCPTFMTPVCPETPSPEEFVAYFDRWYSEEQVWNSENCVSKIINLPLAVFRRLREQLTGERVVSIWQYVANVQTDSINSDVIYELADKYSDGLSQSQIKQIISGMSSGWRLWSIGWPAHIKILGLSTTLQVDDIPHYITFSDQDCHHYTGTRYIAIKLLLGKLVDPDIQEFEKLLDKGYPYLLISSLAPPGYRLPSLRFLSSIDQSLIAQGVKFFLPNFANTEPDRSEGCAFLLAFAICRINIPAIVSLTTRIENQGYTSSFLGRVRYIALVNTIGEYAQQVPAEMAHNPIKDIPEKLSAFIMDIYRDIISIAPLRSTDGVPRRAFTYYSFRETIRCSCCRRASSICDVSSKNLAKFERLIAFSETDHQAQ